MTGHNRLKLARDAYGAYESGDRRVIEDVGQVVGGIHRTRRLSVVGEGQGVGNNLICVHRCACGRVRGLCRNYVGQQSDRTGWRITYLRNCAYRLGRIAQRVVPGVGDRHRPEGGYRDLPRLHGQPRAG